MNATCPIYPRVRAGSLAMLMNVWLIVLVIADHAQAQPVSDSDAITIQTVCSLPLNVDTTFTVTVAIDTRSTVDMWVIPLSFAGSESISIDTAIGENGVTFHPLADLPPWMFRNALIDSSGQGIWVGMFSLLEGEGPSRGPLFDIHFKLEATADPEFVITQGYHTLWEDFYFL